MVSFFPFEFGAGRSSLFDDRSALQDGEILWSIARRLELIWQHELKVIAHVK